MSSISAVNNTQNISLKDTIFEDLLHHPLLLRLKGVNLLGAMGFFQRTAGLSRYEHSLGSAELANKFLSNYHIRDEDRITVLLAALLHDIGHPPFSHSTELSLYQMFYRYHRGQTGLMLRNHTSAFPAKMSIQQIITNDTRGGPTVFRKVLKILRAMSSNRGIREHVYHILTGAINVDTLDAINRAASALGLSLVDPGGIIESLHYDPNEGILINHDALPLVEDFWRLKNAIYQRYIFNLRNQAIEAMINRAVSLAYEDEKRMPPFYFLTDEQLIDVLKSDQRSYFLWELICKEQPFVPIWGNLPTLVNGQGRISFLAGIKTRKSIEHWFAEKLRIPKDERFKVIFHVTTYKRFLLNGSGQLPMWDIPLCRLSEIFKSERKLVFNVFVPSEILSQQNERERKLLIREFSRNMFEVADGEGAPQATI
jgi:hypothetical protein